MCLILGGSLFKINRILYNFRYYWFSASLPIWTAIMFVVLNIHAFDPKVHPWDFQVTLEMLLSCTVSFKHAYELIPKWHSISGAIPYGLHIIISYRKLTCIAKRPKDYWPPELFGRWCEEQHACCAIWLVEDNGHCIVHAWLIWLQYASKHHSEIILSHAVKLSYRDR